MLNSLTIGGSGHSVITPPIINLRTWIRSAAEASCGIFFFEQNIRKNNLKFFHFNLVFPSVK